MAEPKGLTYAYNRQFEGVALLSGPSDTDYKELVYRAIVAFRNLPGMHTIGIGGRERGGQPTGELVLKVFVSAKRPRSKLSTKELIPSEFEGVPTDVVESPAPKLAVAVPGAKLGGPYSEDSGRYRPLVGGVQLAGEHCQGKGTMGFIARVDEPPPERIVAVTAHHALFSSVAAEQAALRVGQPTGDDSVTKCCKGIFGKFLKGYRDATMDAAIVRLDGGTEYFPQIEDIGVVDGAHEVTPAEAVTLTFAVRKRGRTTRVTGGTIQAINAVHVSGSPSNYMIIKPNAEAGGGTATFADQGDSGAAVVSDANEVVGMLFGMASLTAGEAQTGWGFAWAIQDLIARFDADGISLVVDAGTTLNEKRIAPVRPEDASAEAVGIPASEPALIARRIEGDLSSSELGRLLTTLWIRHSAELNHLVNGNRRIATRWQRVGGAALLQCALRSAYSHEVPVPLTIDGRSADECLRDVLDLFDRYGSYLLKRDIGAYRGLIPPVAGRSYHEIVTGLNQQPQGESRWVH